MAIGQDELSRSIIQFKNGNPLHVGAWVDCAVQELAGYALGTDCTIVRALQHSEEKVSGKTSLDILGNALTERYRATYKPELLTKRGTHGKISLLGREERAQALSGRYVFNGGGTGKILVIDDVLTTGATLCAIRQAILAVDETCSIQFFSLAATRRHMNTPQPGRSLQAQTSFASSTSLAEDAEPYSDVGLLRFKILNDQFGD